MSNKKLGSHQFLLYDYWVSQILAWGLLGVPETVPWSKCNSRMVRCVGFGGGPSVSYHLKNLNMFLNLSRSCSPCCEMGTKKSTYDGLCNCWEPHLASVAEKHTLQYFRLSIWSSRVVWQLQHLNTECCGLLCQFLGTTCQCLSSSPLPSCTLTPPHSASFFSSVWGGSSHKGRLTTLCTDGAEDWGGPALRPGSSLFEGSLRLGQALS